LPSFWSLQHYYTLRITTSVQSRYVDAFAFGLLLPSYAVLFVVDFECALLPMLLSYMLHAYCICFEGLLRFASSSLLWTRMELPFEPSPFSFHSFQIYKGAEHTYT
jgi:hypothetical protein